MSQRTSGSLVLLQSLWKDSHNNTGSLFYLKLVDESPKLMLNISCIVYVNHNTTNTHVNVFVKSHLKRKNSQCFTVLQLLTIGRDFMPSCIGVFTISWSSVNTCEAILTLRDSLMTSQRFAMNDFLFKAVVLLHRPKYSG